MGLSKTTVIHGAVRLEFQLRIAHSLAAAPGRTPSRCVARLEAVSAVQEALDALPKHYRRAIWHVHLEGRSGSASTDTSQMDGNTATPSTPAPTTEPEPRSDARNRKRNWALLTISAMSATRNSLRNQPPPTSAPAGPTVSRLTQLAPLSSDTSITKTSAIGELPKVFEYQRQYAITASGSEASMAGEVSVVVPPSTSLLQPLAALFSLT